MFAHHREQKIEDRGSRIEDWKFEIGNLKLKIVENLKLKI